MTVKRVLETGVRVLDVVPGAVHEIWYTHNAGNTHDAGINIRFCCGMWTASDNIDNDRPGPGFVTTWSQVSCKACLKAKEPVVSSPVPAVSCGYCEERIQTMKDLSARLTDATAERERLRDERDSLRKSADDLRSSIDAIRVASSQLRDECDDYHIELDVLKAFNQGLTERLKNAEANATALAHDRDVYARQAFDAQEKLYVATTGKAGIFQGPNLDSKTASDFVLSVVKDFSRFPAGRYPDDWPASGARFRNEFLVPALKKHIKVVVDLDGAGYDSSFLEEAFGGLVRECGYSPKQLRLTLTLHSTDSSLPKEIWQYIDNAQGPDLNTGHDVTTSTITRLTERTDWLEARLYELLRRIEELECESENL